MKITFRDVLEGVGTAIFFYGAVYLWAVAAYVLGG